MKVVFVKIKPPGLDTLIWFVNIIQEFLIVCAYKMLLNCVVVNSRVCFQFAAQSLQSWPTLCDPRDGSPPASSVPGILQARTLEWAAISFSSAWKWKGKVKSLSRVRLLVTPWSAAHQAPPSTGFSRQEFWSGVPSPSPKSFLTCTQILKHFWVSSFLRLV